MELQKIESENISSLPNGVLKIGDLEFPPRKIWMKTYGCQMNYHDSERILSILQDLNFTLTNNQEEADLLIFNTCAVRDLANQKFYSHLGETRRLKIPAKKEGGKDIILKHDVVIAACGCIAQTEGRELVKKYDHLDFAFGTDVIDNVGELVYRAYAGDRKFSVTSWDKSDNYSIETKITGTTPQGFVNIIKGCDKFCSYCIVPFTRGREKSRSIAEVVDDVSRLVEEKGIQEVTLLGQNVNSFGNKTGESLAELIMKLDEIEDLKLLRYTTSHPYDISDELIEVHGRSKKLANHVHFPVQSGSNTVLQRMLRQYTVEHYLERLEKIRKVNPNIAISTDIIAGFPNETEEEHRATIDLLQKAQYDFIYSYKYSMRKGTKSAKMPDILTDDIRKRRLHEIQEFQLRIQEKIRQNMVGKTYRVLVEGKSLMNGIKKWKGRSSCFRIIHFLPENPEQNLQWQWVDVRVTSSTALSAQGEIVKVLGRKF